MEAVEIKNQAINREARPSDRLKPYEGYLTINVNFTNPVTGKTVSRKVEAYKVIEKFLYIEDEKGQRIPFILNDVQVETYKDLVEQKMNGKNMRLNILKSRQHGMSTFIAGLYFVLTIFHPGKKAAIIADKSEHATNLFNKCKFFYDNLPKELQVEKETSNAKELKVKHRNKQFSEIRILVQGDNAGRSGTYQYLHLSEAAFWDDLKGTLTSLLQTVHSTDTDSIVIFETTGNGFNDYKIRWDDDMAGDSGYKPCFFPWYEDKRNQRVYTGFKLLPHEEDLINKFNLSLEQISFYREKYNEFQGDLTLLRQEYPSSPIEAFKTTGASVFNGDLIDEMKEKILELKRTGALQEKKGYFTYDFNYLPRGDIQLNRGSFKESKTGLWRIYKEPVKRHQYIISIDPAMGGKDDYAVQILDSYTMEQVAVFYKSKVDERDLALQIAVAAYWYNEALINAEINNSTGTLILDYIYKTGYRNLYQDSQFQNINDDINEVFGYRTTVGNKTAIVVLFKIAFNNRNLTIYDWKTLSEMETFNVFTSNKAGGQEKYMAASGEHDDLVMSMCGAILARTNMPELTLLLDEDRKPINKPWSPFDTSSIDAEKKKKERYLDIWD